MKLARKVLLVELLFLLILMTGLALTVILFGLPKVEQSERRQLVADLQRVKNGIALEQERLSILASDWGIWDDTYAYAIEPNPKYEESNLFLETLISIKVDLMVIVGPEQQVRWLLTTDQLPRDNINLLQGQQWTSEHPLINQDEDFHQGIFHTELGPLLIARQPILTSREQGPARGYVIFGKLLNKQLVEQLSNSLQLPFSVSSPLHQESNPEITFISRNTALARGYLDFNASPDLKLQIEMQQPREFYQQALVTIAYSMLAILAISLVAALVSYLLMRRMLIKPIQVLQHQTEQFRSHKKQRFPVLQSNDELGQLSLSFVAMAKTIASDWTRLHKERSLYRDASYTDSLTLLRNRRFMHKLLNSPESWEGQEQWAFIAIDIDHFKRINDTYGHDSGDRVLVQFAQLLKQCSRDQDIQVRNGGEEFAIICRDTDIETAKIIVERIRREVEKFVFGDRYRLELTCSLGIFAGRVKSSSYGLKHWQDMQRMSDMALYAAKNSGRNTWVGLECLSQCNDGKFPERNDEITHWIKEKQLRVLSLHHTAEEINWESRSPEPEFVISAE